MRQERGRRPGFRVLIDFSIPPTYVDTERTILKEVPFDFVLLQPSLEVCAERAGSRQEAAITDYVMLKNFYARLKEGTVEPTCDDHANPESLAHRIADGPNQGVFGCFKDFTSTVETISADPQVGRMHHRIWYSRKECALSYCDLSGFEWTGLTGWHQESPSCPDIVLRSAGNPSNLICRMSHGTGRWQWRTRLLDARSFAGNLGIYISCGKPINQAYK